MVRRWGMKEKEAVGNDVSLSSFQAESNYQNSISSSGESNCCPVYSLINTAVLWSCTIKPCFHYLHCSYYDHWKRVTVRPGCCEDSGTLIFCFGSLSLSLSQNAMFSGGEWAAAYCAPQCHWAFSSLLQHIRVFLRHTRSMCADVTLFVGWVCVSDQKEENPECLHQRKERQSEIFLKRSTGQSGLNENSNIPLNTQKLDPWAFCCHQPFSTVPPAVCFFPLITF